MTMSAALSVDSVSKRFGSKIVQVAAVREATLEVRPRELVSLRGPSGCGKSTLLAIAGGLMRPESGEVFIGGRDLYNQPESTLQQFRRRHIGFVFQEYNLLRTFTAAENVMLVTELNGVTRRVARKSALDALDRVGMRALADRFPAELSGGQQQRVAIARAICGGQDLILADEPTGALDSENARKVLDLLLDLAREGAACLVVTHDATVAAAAHRGYEMRDGVLSGRSGLA